MIKLSIDNALMIGVIRHFDIARGSAQRHAKIDPHSALKPTNKSASTTSPAGRTHAAFQLKPVARTKGAATTQDQPSLAPSSAAAATTAVASCPLAFFTTIRAKNTRSFSRSAPQTTGPRR